MRQTLQIAVFFLVLSGLFAPSINSAMAQEQVSPSCPAGVSDNRADIDRSALEDFLKQAHSAGGHFIWPNASVKHRVLTLVHCLQISKAIQVAAANKAPLLETFLRRTLRAGFEAAPKQPHVPNMARVCTPLELAALLSPPTVTMTPSHVQYLINLFSGGMGIRMLNAYPKLGPVLLSNLRSGNIEGAIAAADNAGATQIAKLIRERVTYTNDTIYLKCTPEIPLDPATGKGMTIKKTIKLSGTAASGITLDCRGGAIQLHTKNMRALEISSKKSGDIWQAPSNITVKNCNLYGDIRIYGGAQNGEGSFNVSSSRKADHTKTMQSIAPNNIKLDKLTITATEKIPLYLAPGVHHVSLTRSVIKGSARVGIYLDAESGYNTITNNTIAVDTRFNIRYCKWGICVYVPVGREQIAVDGSAHNVISNNRLSGLSWGGINLYRNCGEGGAVRHQTPSYNTIENNSFYYDKYDGYFPAIWLSSRDGKVTYEINVKILGIKIQEVIRFDIDFCKADKGYAFGSSVNDNDFASYNVIRGNTHTGKGPKAFIRVGSSAKNNQISTLAPNVVGNKAEAASGVPVMNSVDGVRDAAKDEAVIFDGGGTSPDK